jgi:hypothetical protein
LEAFNWPLVLGRRFNDACIVSNAKTAKYQPPAFMFNMEFSMSFPSAMALPLNVVTTTKPNKQIAAVKTTKSTVTAPSSSWKNVEIRDCMDLTFRSAALLENPLSSVSI